MNTRQSVAETRSQCNGGPLHTGIRSELTQSAAQKGRNPDELVQDVLAQYFEEETRYAEAVKRGEYLTHEQVGERLQRFLQT